PAPSPHGERRLAVLAGSRRPRPAPAARFLPGLGRAPRRAGRAGARHARHQREQRVALGAERVGTRHAQGGPTGGPGPGTSGDPYVIAFVLVLAFLLLLVAFRSIVIPLKAIVLNLLSVGASYGVLVLVFQHHWAEPILGFTSNGSIISWLPLFLFVVLFGLSMDYHVFILSRVREGVDAGMATDEAVRHGITVTAGVVTS